MKQPHIVLGALGAVIIALICVAVFGPHLLTHSSAAASATHPPAALAAPQPLEPGAGVTVDDRSITFQWTASPGAQSYLIAIQICNHDETCADANVTSLPLQTSATTHFTSTALSAYLNVNARWRVWAVDAAHTVGPPTPWSSFHAVMVLH